MQALVTRSAVAQHFRDKKAMLLRRSHGNSQAGTENGFRLALRRVQRSLRSQIKRATAWTTLGLTTLGVTALGGCHRQYYRRQADLEAHGLIDEKAMQGCVDQGHSLRVQADPRSRLFNPFDLDFQPMPPDDPRSHQLMHRVDGKKGYPLWHAAGTTNTAENPDWWQYLPLDENGVLHLNAESAVQLALLHSPIYQQNIETLYLSALDVSSERFRFDTQFFGGARSFLTADGRDRAGAGGNSSTRSEVGPYSNGRRPLAIQRSLASGGDLIAGFANSIVWELSGPNTQSASTVFDFAMLQPLLRGAGRDRILERLTLSERRLLSNVRSFERFRRSFYLNITMGRQIESQTRRSGGVFGVGLSGFTGLGSGFAGLNGGGQGGQAGFGGGGGNAGVPQAGGFLGLLQNQLQIRNVEENVARLKENLLILEDTLVELLTTIPEDAEAIPRQKLQIAQARSAILGAQTQLVARKTDYQNSLDNFLGNLGLPPYLCVRIEDPMLDRFELIDGILRGRREELIELRTAAGNINLSLLESSNTSINPSNGLPESRIQWNADLAERIGQLRDALKPLHQFRRELLEEDLPRVAVDLDRLDAALEARANSAKEMQDALRRNRQQICQLVDLRNFDEESFAGTDVKQVAVDLRAAFEKLSVRFDAYAQQIDKLDKTLAKFSAATKPDHLSDQQLASAIRNDVVLRAQDLLTIVADDVLELQLIQARCRTESVLLPDIKLDQRTAFEIAQANRPDLANARAALVDSWRLIEFNADDLESSLDVVFSGDVQNVGNNPLDLRDTTGRLRVGLQWDAPLTRLQERNTYRQSLIEYEQAKRNYYQFEDNLWQLLRGELRQVLTNQINFELGRQSVRIAAEQLELNEDIREFRDARGLSSGPTAARDTISALTDLLNSQNTLLNIFVNYEVIRRSLDFDLGTMQLTPEGLWIDPGPLTPETLGAAAGYYQSGGMLEEPVNTAACLSCGMTDNQLIDAQSTDIPVTNGNAGPVVIQPAKTK